MKVRTAVRRLCDSCYLVRKKGRLYVYCRADGRHKQRSPLAAWAGAVAEAGAAEAGAAGAAGASGRGAHATEGPASGSGWSRGGLDGAAGAGASAPGGACGGCGGRGARRLVADPPVAPGGAWDVWRRGPAAARGAALALAASRRR